MAALAPRLSAYGGSYFEGYLPRIGQFVLKAVTPSLLHNTSSATSADGGDLCALPPAALLRAAAGKPATDPWSAASGSTVLGAPSALGWRADPVSSGPLVFPALDGTNRQLLRSVIARLGDPAVSNLIRGCLGSYLPMHAATAGGEVASPHGRLGSYLLMHTATAGGGVASPDGGYYSGSGFSRRVLVLNMDGIVVLNPDGSSGCRGLFCGGLSGLDCDRPVFKAVLRESIVDQILKNISTMMSKMLKKMRTMVSKMLQDASDPTLDKLFQVIVRGASLVAEQILKLSKVAFFNIMQATANPMMRKVFLSMVSVGADLFEQLDKIEAHGKRITKYCLVIVPIVTWLSMDLSLREFIDLLVLRVHKKSSMFKQEVLDYRQLCIDKEEATKRGITVDELVAARQKASQAEEAARLAAKKMEEQVEAMRKENEAFELAKKKRMAELEEANYRLSLLYDHRSVA